MTIRCTTAHALADAWDALTATQSPLADAAWVRCFADAFGEPLVVHEVREGDRLVAAVPVTRAASTLAAPGRAWRSLDNEHHPYFLVAGELGVDAAGALLEHALAGVEYLFLRRLPVRDPSCAALVAAARRRGLPCVQIESAAGDARIVLDGARLPKNFQRDLPRKQRQLARKGRLAYGEHRAPGAALDAALAACFDVETRGWKGTDGSPVVRDPKTLRFYGELARALAARQRFALYTLSLDDRIIAFEYALRGGGHIEMLKLSFDPAFAAHSPGQVLRMMLLERELARGEIRYYHLGRPSEWKLRWATEVAPLCTLRIYGRGVRARAAHLLGPVLRDRLKRSRLVARLLARPR